MTSRERILAAVNHQEPDRVPIDLGATPSSGISAIGYGKLTKHLGIPDSVIQVYDVVQQLAQPEEFILDRFNVDVLDIGRTFNSRPCDWYDIKLADGQLAQYPIAFRPELQEDGSWYAYKNGELLAEMPVGATFFDQAYFPWEDAWPDDFNKLDEEMGKVLWAAFVHSPWDHCSDDGFWETLRENTIKLSESSDRALMVVCGCNLFEWGTFLRRIDNFMMDLILEEAKVESLLEELMKRHLATLEKVCKAVGDVVDILRFGDDLGIDNGPFMSPDIYRKIFKKHHTTLNAYVHNNSQMKTFLHSCGSIYKLMPDLIEAGYDVINPVQTNCKDMEPEKLKTEFGNDICFWGGGCDTRSILNRGTEQEVKDHVKRNLDILMPGGGFVFNTVHNIMPDVPPKNVLAMFETIANY